MHLIYLSLSEREMLGRHLKSSPITAVRLKAQTILLRAQGVKVVDIAAALLTSERTVTRWLKEFVTIRLGSIFSGYKDNENAAKLTKQQREEIKAVVGKPPYKHGIPDEFWDVPKLRDYVLAEFGVVYESATSYHFLLKFSGLSFKYPDLLSPRRDEEAIEKRMEEIRQEIEPLLLDENWVVLTSDETRVQLEAEIRRAWLVKGKRTVVKTERSSEHQNYLGFLDQKSHVCQVFEIERGNSKETIRVLRKIVQQYPNKRICIIWDNAKWHKSKELREELKTGKSLERIHLISLPPYAPENNPIEHVWGAAKAKIANKSNVLFEEIKKQFTSFIGGRTFMYQI